MSLMKRKRLREALDESLSLLREGQATVDECLTRYPQHADALRPLLKIALKATNTPSPECRPIGYAAGKQRMLEALSQKQYRLETPAKPPRPSRGAGRLATVPSKLSPALLIGLAAMVVCVLILTGAFLSPWNGLILPRTAKLVQTYGTVEVLPKGNDTWEPARTGQVIRAGDRVRTDAQALATVTFFDDSLINMENGTALTFVELNVSKKTSASTIILHQASGQTYSRVKSTLETEARFEIQSPSAMVTAQGTAFEVSVEQDGSTRVAVAEGSVEVAAQEQVVTLLAGEETFVRSGEAPLPAQPATATPVPPATATLTPTPTALPESPNAPEPPGEEDTDQPIELDEPVESTETPQPPGLTKTPQPPGLTKTPQPPGLTKTPQPPGLTKTPPGQAKTPGPPGKPDDPGPPDDPPGKPDNPGPPNDPPGKRDDPGPPDERPGKPDDPGPPDDQDPGDGDDDN